jgi:urease accessory protein
MLKLELLHVCDSLFPVGAFAYSDGLESATSTGVISSAEDLRAWIDVVLDETIGRAEGPVVWRAWQAVRDRDRDALVRLDEEVTALKPAASARQSSRAMGLRLITTWRTLHPDPRLEHLLAHVKNPALPIAFAAACASSGVEQRESVEAFAYTRLAATISAAMRLMPIGQTDAHTLLARTLARVPRIVDAIAERDGVGGEPESFTPAMDIAVMSQQYLHSRLFRS